MEIQQFVLAYQAEQDRLRALLPAGVESLRPVLRINAELRGGPAGTVYLELNTPVAAFGKRGWWNVGRWESPAHPLTARQEGAATTFQAPFLTLTYTQTGAVGGCPAEKDNDGCFYPQEGEPRFVPAEAITAPRAFCDVDFQWAFAPGDAQGRSQNGKTLPALPTPPKVQYPRQPLTPQAAAAIPGQQVLGAYTVQFRRGAGGGWRMGEHVWPTRLCWRRAAGASGEPGRPAMDTAWPGVSAIRSYRRALRSSLSKRVRNGALN